MSEQFNSVDQEVFLALHNNSPAVTAVRSEGERSDPERITAVTRGGEAPDPEVVGRAVRRRFTAAYKQRILTEADAAVATGEIGRILRREGLYSSQIAAWRRARADSERAALRPKKRGPRPAAVNPLQAENAKLKSENVILQKKLRTAGLMIDLQKKVSQILGITLPVIEQNDDDEVSL
jgi:transposase-like protein